MIIREKNEKDLLKINDYLDLVFRSTYESFLKDEIDGLIVESFICENPNGFVYVSKNEEHYAIKFAFEKNPSRADVQCIHNKIEQYFNDKEIKKIYITTNSSSVNIVNFYDSIDVKRWYSAYELEFTSDSYEYTVDDLVFKPYEEKYIHEFISLLDESFKDMRIENNIVPAEYYASNIEDSKKEFIELNEEGKIRGIWNRDVLIGVTIVEGNEIDTIAIRREHQNKGYGRRIVNYLMNHLINEKKYKTIHLGVIASNKIAHDLYIKCGCYQVGSITYLKRV